MSKAIKDPESICFNCLEKKSNIKDFYIYRNDFGSTFDNFHIKIQICNDCKPNDFEKWIDEEPEIEDYCAIYQYEDNIWEFIDQMPVEGQELALNRFASGAMSLIMEPQDWIDYELDILSHEKCKEYGFISPQEKKTYKERFPVCKHVVNVIYDDNSKASRCPFGTFGEYGQKASIRRASIKCYNCDYFEIRDKPIELVQGENFNDYKIYYISKLKEKEYKYKFEKRSD